MSASRASRIATALPTVAPRVLPRLRRLSPAEGLLLLQAPLALPAVALALRRWGLQPVQQRLLRGAVVARPPATAAERLAMAERLAWCVQVSAAYGPWPANCLQRSVTLCWYLHRRGLAGDLRIGVRRGEQPDDRPLDFHAWVEHEGVVINDARDVGQRYAVFPRAVDPGGARFS